VEASGRLLARHVATWLAHSEDPAQVLADVPVPSAAGEASRASFGDR